MSVFPAVVNTALRILGTLGTNPKMPITTIIAQISTAGGLARPNRFSVQVVPPKIFSNNSLGLGPLPSLSTQNSINAQANATGVSPQSLGLPTDYFKELGVEAYHIQSRLDFMCLKAELPGKGFATTDAKTYGATFKMPSVDTYGDINLQFIVGRDMVEKTFFDAWSYTVQDPETSDFNYVDEYATTVDIYQLDEFGNQTYGVRLYQAWPVGIGQMQLDYSNNDTFQILPVQFTYRKWISLGVPTSGNSLVGQISGAVNNALQGRF